MARLDDLLLCDECAAKLDRDLIRERDWDYSMSAAVLDATQREELRRRVINQHGEALELIAPGAEGGESKGKRRKDKKKGKTGKGKTRKGKTGKGKTGKGKTGKGKTRKGKTRKGKKKRGGTRGGKVER
jgi:hypothetical protein